MKLRLIAAGALASAFVGINASAVTLGAATEKEQPHRGVWKVGTSNTKSSVEGFEAEIAFGTGSLRGHNGRSLEEWVPQLVLEARAVDNASEWDVAMQFEIGSARNRHDGYRTSQYLMSFYGDYNVRPAASPLQFFVGAGLGWGYVNDPELGALWSDEDGETTANVLLFSPRIGLEYRNRLRLTIDRKWMDSYSATFFSVGVVFGGGRR